MPRVFISYSRKDGDFARKLAKSLDQEGVRVWIDVDSIPPGVNWVKAIENGLEICEFLVLIVSPDSLASTNVTDEWQYFRINEKPIIPVLREPVKKLPFPLNSIQWIDFCSQGYDAALLQLIEALKVPVPIKSFFEWVEIPAGKVILENCARVEGGTKGGEYNISTFYISKYPVTNAQYLEFVAAPDGYQEPSWWDYSDEARKWWNGHPIATVSPFTGDDVPCTKVCWYSAIAYCRWISRSTHQIVTLPTEQQWQHAAQGDSHWLYPWGDKFDKKRCNSSVKMKSGGPTPVSQYLNGGSEYQVMDLCGNVWEWCLTEWGTDNTDLKRDKLRIIRGGAWNCPNQQTLQVTYRGRRTPDIEMTEIGFRCVQA